MKKKDLVNYWTQNKIITDKSVLDAFLRVPRENFVLPQYKDQAYEDIPLPTKKGQTISQPTTVMIMTQALEVKKEQKILEVGTGSGYQAAILSVLVGDKDKVYTTEILKELYDFAKENLKDYKNVTLLHKDASKGLDEFAPFDRIIITAAATKMPQKLLQQLKIDGIMLVPFGENKYVQKMLKITKQKDQNKIEDLGNFVFVPLN